MKQLRSIVCSLALAGSGILALGLCQSVAAEDIRLHAALLPSEAQHFVYSQSGNRNQIFYATLINDSDVLLQNCRVEMANALPFILDYQTTEREQNRLVGRANAPLAIAPRGSQTLQIGLRLARDEFVERQKTGFRFVCDGAQPAAVVEDINTVLLSAGTPPTPDLLSAIAVSSNSGLLELDPDPQGTPCRFNPFPGAADVRCGIGAYAFVLLNGSQDVLELEVVENSGMQFSQLCQTDAAAVCITTAAPRFPLSVTLAAGELATFSAYLVSVDDFAFNPFAELQSAGFTVRARSGTSGGSGQVLALQQVAVTAPPFEWSAEVDRTGSSEQLSVSGSKQWFGGRHQYGGCARNWQQHPAAGRSLGSRLLLVRLRTLLRKG